MKKFVLLLLLFSGFTILKSQTVTVVTTSNGIAPIPAFTLGEPATLVFLNLKLTEHLSITPDASFSMKSGDLWFTDLWLRYNISLDSAKKWTATFGLDFPSFIGVSSVNNAGKKVSATKMYTTGQLRLERKIGLNDLLVLDYWYLRAIDMSAGIKGSYLSLTYNLVKPVNMLSFMVIPNIFYLNFSDETKGFAGALDVKILHPKSGLFISSQGMTPLIAKKVKPGWNVSIGISRKIF